MVNIKVLIAEDEVITSMDLWHILERWGYLLCRQASSGEEAVRTAEKDKPDIALLDINLKGEIGGIEAGRQITALNIPIIFITGYSDPETRERAASAKPAGYFVKPLDFRQLQSTIDAVVQKNKRRPVCDACPDS